MADDALRLENDAEGLVSTKAFSEPHNGGYAMSFNDCPDANAKADGEAGAIDMVLVPRAVDLGEMTVRRALPASKRQMVGPFIFFDQMGPASFDPGQGVDVRPHPHINLSTLTYLFDGEILHRDSLGTQQRIRPGAVNLMKAGRGIVHSERTSPQLKASGQRLFGLQTWMALPLHAEEDEPEFIHMSADTLPTFEGDGVSGRVIAGSAFGESSRLKTASETLYCDLNLEAGKQLQIDADTEERALYTISGKLEIDGQIFEPGQMIILKTGAQSLVTASDNARLVLIGGAAMEGPRYIWWNFVSSRRERIEQAKEDWREGRFDTVPGDDKQFIPLPEDSRAVVKAVGGVLYP